MSSINTQPRFIGDITIKDLEIFKQDYLNNKYPEQRFGQAFYNQYFSGTVALEEWQRVPWPELFYEKNSEKAEAIILESIKFSVMGKVIECYL